MTGAKGIGTLLLTLTMLAVPVRADDAVLKDLRSIWKSQDRQQ